MSVTDLSPPKSKIGALRATLLALLEEHERDGMIPTNARFLFYELVQRGRLSKEKTGARRPDQDPHEMFAALMIGHHFSISALCCAPSASGVCLSRGQIS